jgi:hypothetical protein
MATRADRHLPTGLYHDAVATFAHSQRRSSLGRCRGFHVASDGPRETRHVQTKAMPEDESDPNGALARMRGLMFGFCVSRSIATGAELRIADVASGSRTVAELANECGVQERPLFRVLRALAGEGVRTEGEVGRFGLTPNSCCL